MAYAEAMEAAGAEVLAFKEFGSYQGSWWAKVKFEGKTYWIAGSYGSCSGCDAFQAEFGYGDKEHCDEHSYDYSDNPQPCANCAKALAAYNQRLAEFGRSYLFGNEHTQEEAEESCGATSWRDEYDEQLAFLKENAIEGA